MLVDPENGDYSVVSGSPAEDYGCQIFLPSSRENILSNNSKKFLPQVTSDRSSIEVGGTITSDEFWNADTIYVVDDITIEDGATVSITFGSEVIFQDFYSMEVFGSLQAVGNADNRIHFRSADPYNFEIDHSESGAWNGIKFIDILSSNEPSRLEYCIFEYSKSFEESGGVVHVSNVTELEIINCIFKYNLADYGAAISCEYHSAPKITGNLFFDNFAFISGSPVYCTYSYPRFTNNTIISNYVLNEETFHETAGLHTYISKPQIRNNILWDNETYFYDPQQLMNCKAYYTTYNDVQFGHLGKGNIDENPYCVGSGEIPFSLVSYSPCINSGTNELPFGLELPEFDLAGNMRTYNDTVDIGAFEWNGTGIENYELPISNARITNYPNPFNPSTTITFNFNSETAENTELVIYNLKGQKVKTIIVTLSGVEGSVTWNGTDQNNKPVSSGIYFAKIKAGNKILTKKMMLIK